jgi:hypothetical protein
MTLAMTGCSRNPSSFRSLPRPARTSTQTWSCWFNTPQRIPSLRVFGAQTIGLSYFQSRRAAGVQIDGLDLRAEDQVAAVETLAAAGVERVDRTGAWLRRHRRVTQDPDLIHVVEVNDRRQRWVGAVVTVVVILVVGLSFFGDDNPSNWELGALGLALLVIFGLPVSARRRGARPLDAERNGGKSASNTP